MNKVIWIIAFILLCIFFALLTYKFGLALWEEAIFYICSRSWWAENIPSFVIFTLLFGAVSYIVNKTIDSQYRRQYENWVVCVKWNNKEIKQDLFWEEVEKFQKSDFERWKFVKSIVSGIGSTSLITVHAAEKSDTKWVFIEHDNKRIFIDLDAACKYGHVKPRITSNINSSESGNPL